MLRYRMDLRNGDELAQLDPFEGRGLFLASDLADGESILGRVSRIFGRIPAVAFPTHGAWLDTAGLGLGSDEAKIRWAQEPEG